MFVVRNKQLLRAAQPFVSVGFNYHPSTTGCQYWQEWNPDQIDTDLRAMSDRGFNTVRFFIFWADVEPAPGQYDGVIVDRLKTFVAIARRHRLFCIPALLTIWMNGQLFDLPWRRGRNLWTDAEMVCREIAYVGHIATALRDADNVLAYDLGDEVIHVDFASAQALSRGAVSAWQRALAGAIREADPDALVLQGNEASAVLGDHEFRPDTSRALDLIAIHGFPVWAPFAIESIASPKSSSYVPFLVQLARIDGAVLVDELGSYGADDKIASDYIRAVAHSALANGASGIIVWCWQDFSTTAKPFDRSPSERFVGLLDVDGRPKPAMDAFQLFARRAGEWAAMTVPPAPIGIYVPQREERSDQNYLQPGDSFATAVFYAYLLLKRAHLPFEFTRGPLNSYRLVICPSVERISLREQELLADYVSRGGVVYYSAGEYLHGFGGEQLFGVRLTDFTLRAEDMAHFTWDGQEYPVWSSGHRGAYTRIPIIATTTAEVLATFPNGTPALTRRAYGQGWAYYLNAPLERQLDEPFRLDLTRWEALYDHLARSAGVQREIDVDVPDVELAVMCDDARHYGFMINHSPETVQATVSRAVLGSSTPTIEQIALAGKDVHVLSWEAPREQ
jgi:hypothetical protein